MIGVAEPVFQGVCTASLPLFTSTRVVFQFIQVRYQPPTLKFNHQVLYD